MHICRFRFPHTRPSSNCMDWKGGIMLSARFKSDKSHMSFKFSKSISLSSNESEIRINAYEVCTSIAHIIQAGDGICHWVKAFDQWVNTGSDTGRFDYLAFFFFFNRCCAPSRLCGAECLAVWHFTIWFVNSMWNSFVRQLRIKMGKSPQNTYIPGNSHADFEVW